MSLEMLETVRVLLGQKGPPQWYLDIDEVDWVMLDYQITGTVLVYPILYLS